MRDRDVSGESLAQPDDREYLVAVLGALTSGVVAFDRRFVVRWFNRSAADYFPDLVTGRSLYELLKPFSREEKIDRLLLGQGRVTIDLGKDRPTTDWMLSRRQPEGDDRLVLLWPTHLADEMNERRASFTMAAFHELRTPLTVVLGFAGALEREADGMSPEQREAVEIICQAGRQLSDLTNDIFDLVQDSFGELRLSLAEVDLTGLVSSVVDTQRPRLESEGQAIRLEAEPGLPPIEADPDRIRQVMHNLIGNAGAHNPAGTVIKIGISRFNDSLRLVVEDNGNGLAFVPPERAFDNFFRPEPPVRSGHQGSGIGLPLVKALIELHRGRLTLESTPGEGTRASIWLPLDRATALDSLAPGPL